MPISDMVRTLLEKRGMTNAYEVEKFLNPDYARDMHAPELLHDMKRAVSRLLAAIQQEEKIALYADFDCDGIPGAALLYDFFKKIGYKNLVVYIPHRDREGYGFHKKAAEELAQQGVSLIITVDVGTTAADTVSFAKEKGADVIVTDHHELVGTIPNAAALVNPKAGRYPFQELCGTAVAWKLACATIAEGRQRKMPGFINIPEGWEKWLLDLVAIATIADMMPLIGENRALVHFGLKVLRKSPRQGLRALCTALRMNQNELAEDDIGFSIAPRVNAASRMGEPELAFRLLTTENPDEAEHLAQELERLNVSRKGAVGAIVREAKRKVRARFSDNERVVVIGDTEWRPALLGLAANSVLSERAGIVCLWGRDVNGHLKGSCRSDGSISVTELFKKANAALTEYGGHNASGGFSVSAEHVHTLPEVLARAANGIEQNTNVQVKNSCDMSVPLAEISWQMFQELSLLAPFGVGNPKPMLRILGSHVSAMRRFGKAREHIEVSLECRISGKTMRCFQFFTTPENFSVPPIPGQAVAALATLERDSYRGSGALALRVTDILPA